MDRLKPSMRPRAPVIGFQRWDDLLFVHWELPPDALRPLVPPRLELDTFDGCAFVSITPFTALRRHPPHRHATAGRGSARPLRAASAGPVSGAPVRGGGSAPFGPPERWWASRPSAAR